MHEEILARIPQGTPDHSLEVVLLHDGAGTYSVELRSLLWSAGVGWYCQHTLRLERTAARALLHTLGHVQARLGSGEAPRQGRSIIPFPAARRLQGEEVQASPADDSRIEHYPEGIPAAGL